MPDDQLTGLDRWILGEFSQLEQEVIARLRPIRVPRGVSEGQPVRRRRALGHLSRRGQGPALHRSRRIPPGAARPRPRCTGWSSASARCSRRSWPSRPTRPGSLCPGKTVDSVHQLTWQPLGFERPEAERAAWKALFELRELALPELEKARQAKAHRQGAGGEADVRRLKLRPGGSRRASGCAAGAVERLPTGNQAGRRGRRHGCRQQSRGREMRALLALGDRCWLHPEHPTICARCVKAVAQAT